MTPLPRASRSFLPGIAALLLAWNTFAATPAGPPGAIDFNRDIQPILADNCYACHGPDAKARKAKLRLDIREGVFGEAGSGLIPVVPGKPEESELIARIFSTDPEEMMPHPDS